jgi:hypothetical protein
MAPTPRQPLSLDDWVFLWRTLTLWHGPISARQAFGSDLLGAGRGFATDTGIDERTAIRQLRWIQRKIST